VRDGGGADGAGGAGDWTVDGQKVWTSGEAGRRPGVRRLAEGAGGSKTVKNRLHLDVIATAAFPAKFTAPPDELALLSLQAGALLPAIIILSINSPLAACRECE
jgi:hypothetical protein